MKRHFFAIALMLALGLPAIAEPEPASITGVVNDETGAALPGATVNASGPGGAHMATTGADGRFTITGLAAGNYKVTADLMGFRAQTQTVTVSATSGVNLSFGLGIALRGEEVVVSASKSESALVDAPATLSVVSSEQILASPAQNMGDLLRSVPGVNIIQTSARDINITARQGTSTLHAPFRPESSCHLLPLHPRIGVVALIGLGADCGGQSGSEDHVGETGHRGPARSVGVAHQVEPDHVARLGAVQPAEVGAQVIVLVDETAWRNGPGLRHDAVEALLPERRYDRALLVEYRPHGDAARPHVRDLANVVRVPLADQDAEFGREVVALAPDAPSGPGKPGVVHWILHRPAPRQTGQALQRDQFLDREFLEQRPAEGQGRTRAAQHPGLGGADAGWPLESRDLPPQGRRTVRTERDHAVRCLDPRGVLALAPVAAEPALPHVDAHSWGRPGEQAGREGDGEGKQAAHGDGTGRSGQADAACQT